MENSEHKRNLYIDIWKGIAIILVVFGHCLQYGSGDIDIYRWLIGFLGSILVMILVKFSVNISQKVNKILAYLGTKTMGIYIISNYLNTYVLLPLCSKFQFNYIYTIIETIVILFLSCIFTFLIGKQKFLGKLFLGGR